MPDISVGDDGTFRIVGEVRFCEAPNAAGDLVWTTALITPSGKKIDLGCLLDLAPENTQKRLSGARVHIIVEELRGDRAGSWGPWVEGEVEGEGGGDHG